MRLLFRIRQLNRSGLIGFSSLCLGLILIVLNPIGLPRSINLPPTLTPTPSTQVGFGRDVFYLKCMPCHGDQGQGLTDEFRTRQYPPEDQNCWKSGCHGDKPYFNGFALPKTVPALIGPGTLSHFPTAQEMYNFVSKAMPFNKPGSLSQTEYLQVMAYILSSHQLIPADAQLDITLLANITIHLPSADAMPTPSSTSSTSAELPPAFWGIIIFLIIATILSFVTRRRKS